MFVHGWRRPDQQPSVLCSDLRGDRLDDRTELTSQPVASCRWTDRSADREGDAQRNGRRIVEKGAPQRFGSGRATRSCQASGTSGVRGSSRSSRQPGAALEAPGLDDRATCTGTHAGAKAVLAGSTASIWLVSALHDFSTFSDSTSNSQAPRPADQTMDREGETVRATEPERIKARASSIRSTTARRWPSVTAGSTWI